MNNQLYIPKTITVGQQKRTDTFTGKLAYIIYTDHTGKLRKETSWQGWRDREIEPLTFDNNPEKGFTFNKGIQRDGHWGSGRSVVRVWDPRDFEFEISIDNLIGILMHADVSKRDITEPCVFAWKGTELILLPMNSLEYQESIKFTAKQELKFTAKQLVAGHSYSVKKSPLIYVYLGYFDQYSHERVYDTDDRHTYYNRHVATVHKKKKSKSHVFYDVTNNRVEILNPSTHIAAEESQELHGDYAVFMDKYYTLEQSQPVIGLHVNGKDNYYNWHQLGDNQFVQLSISDDGGVQYQTAAMWNAEKQQAEFGLGYVAGSYYVPARAAQYLPGLGPQDPKVVDLIERIRAAMPSDEMIALRKYVPTEDYATRNEKYVKASAYKKAVQNQFNLGSLHFVMADGKKSTDQTL